MTTNDPTTEDQNRLCPDCGAMMHTRTERYGPFYSCDRYPECKGNRSMRDVAQTEQDPFLPSSPVSVSARVEITGPYIDVAEARERTLLLASAAGIDGEIAITRDDDAAPKRRGGWSCGTLRASLGTLHAVVSGISDSAEKKALLHLYREARKAAEAAAMWSVVRSAVRAVENHRDRAATLRERAARLRAEAEAADREAELHERALIDATALESTMLASLTDAQRAALAAVRADAKKEALR